MTTRLRPPLFRLAALLTVLLGACVRRPPSRAPNARDQARAAPDSFVVVFETTRGRFDVLARRSWAPAGADRLYDLVRHGFYDGARFFRVVPGFVAQFGIPADPAVAAAWRDRRLNDDTVRWTNRRGTLSFARGGPNTRTTQLFLNLRDNARLDTLNRFGFPPVGEVTEGGMAVVDSLYGGYGEGPPRGRGPSQDSVRLHGERYLARGFPLLDAIRTARIVYEWR